MIIKGASMAKAFKGRIYGNHKTKNLIPLLKQGDIALINHEDLDEVAADSLIASRVKAVLNTKSSCTGRFPNLGPYKIVRNKIVLIDKLDKSLWEKVKSGQEVWIKGSKVFDKSKRFLAEGNYQTSLSILKQLNKAKQNFNAEMASFIKNTIEHANKEMYYLFDKLDLSNIKTDFNGRHCLIIVRGQDYKKDLQAIRPYIQEVKPVLVGVDGGADALIEQGFKPDLIIGDMDSVSDAALKCNAELVVHAYPNGKAPGLDRLVNLNIDGIKTVPAFGTSEDVAMLIAYEKGSKLIVAVGTHSNIIDFLEKGRKGMASTFLVRLKVGPILIDAKGVNQLYKQRFRSRYLIEMLTAALIPFIIVFMVSPPAYQLARLILLKLKLLLSNVGV